MSLHKLGQNLDSSFLNDVKGNSSTHFYQGKFGLFQTSGSVRYQGTDGPPSVIRRIAAVS